MRKIKVGVQLHPQHVSYATYAAAVQRTESLGVDSIWNWDHFFPLYGGDSGNNNHFEGWTLLTAIAMLTSKVEIGTLVTCNSYRKPALLTQMANTVEHISGGRLILGIGAGWFEKDYVEFGYEFGTAGSRLRDLGAALPIIKQRMRAELPPPLRASIPIMNGGGGEKVTVKLTAQYADLWNGFGPPEVFKHKCAVLDNWCAEVGRDVENRQEQSGDQRRADERKQDPEERGHSIGTGRAGHFFKGDVEILERRACQQVHERKRVQRQYEQGTREPER